MWGFFKSTFLEKKDLESSVCLSYIKLLYRCTYTNPKEGLDDPFCMEQNYLITGGVGGVGANTPTCKMGDIFLCPCLSVCQISE